MTAGRLTRDHFTNDRSYFLATGDRMTALFTCSGCGALANSASPQPARCGLCPPSTCASCGEADSLFKPCSCWVDMAMLADAKAAFAADGTFNVDADGRMTTA